MGISFNPLVFSGLINIPPAGAVTWRGSVPTEGDLPSSGNTLGDAIAVQNSGKIYVWSGSPEKWHDTGITTAAFGNTPNSDGYSIVVNNSDPLVRKDTLVLQPADATNPGGVTASAQTFAGDKTFNDDVIVEGLVDAKGGIDSSTNTLTIGANADFINIGGSGATITINGDTTYEHVTDLVVKDKTITLNDGGGAASAANSGIEIEEASIITGYAQVSSDRNSWELKAPNQSGIATISPGASGITLDQSSHDPVTLTITPNGLSLFGQELSISAASPTDIGVVTISAQTFAGDKTFEDSIIAESDIDAQGGVDSSTGTLELGSNTAQVNIGDAAGNTDIVGTVTIEYNPADPTDWAPAPNDVIEAIDQLADRFTTQDQVTNEPTGFPDRNHSEILFDDNSGNPIFTIQPKAPYTSYDIYIKGKKYTKSSAETVTSLSHPSFPYTGNNYFYFDENGVLQVTNVFSAAIIQQYAFISIAYWNTDTNTHTYFAEERHGLTMDGATHSYLHTVFGARFLSGLALQGFSVDGPGSNNADAQFTSDSGTIRDEDILHQIAAQTQIPILFRQGQQWRKKTADAFPVIHGGTAGYVGQLLPYNQYTGGAWQLTEVQDSKFVLVHFFGTNDVDNPFIGIQGITEYNSIENARIGANAEISSLSGLPFAEFVPVGSVIFQTRAFYTNTPRARVRSTDTGANYVDFRGSQLYTPAGTATTHGLLSGLANDDHFQYLLADGTRAMSGALSMGSHQINDVVDPSSAQDAATKNYVDSAVTGTTSYFAGFDSTTGVLTEVPGYTFDDSGSLQVGAQNSITVPAGTTDYTSISISPTISNPGLINLTGVQLNTPIDSIVTNYNGFQVFGYGTNSPDNFISYLSQPGYTTSATGDITHFRASGSFDTSATSRAFDFSSSGDATDIIGVNISPSGDATTFSGVTVQPSGTLTDASGLKVDYSSATITNRPVGLEINGGALNSTITFTTTSSLPILVDSGNVIRPIFEIEAGTPITDTDVLMTNLAGFMDFKDDHSGSAGLDLGVASVGFVSQVAADSGVTVDKISMSLAGLAVDSTSAGGTITDAALYRGSAFTFGGTLTIDDLYGLKIENTLSDKANNAWGISVEDVNAENYLAKSLVIGGVSKTTTSNEMALEIADAKTIKVGSVTTAERNALSNIAGSVVYDTDKNRFFGNDGFQWIQLNLSLGDIDRGNPDSLAVTAVATDITGFSFSSTEVKGFEAIVSVSRTSPTDLYAEYTLKGVYKGASWEMSQDYIGDDTGIIFNITSVGQIQYTLTAGQPADFTFRASTV